MPRAGRTIRVYPDAERVEQALVDAAVANAGFVDASAFFSFAQLVQACEGGRHLGRRPASPLTARVVLWAAAHKLPPGPFRGFVNEPAFARAALELIFDLKAASCGVEELAQAVKKFPEARRERGELLAGLYGAYEKQMAKLTLADREDVLSAAEAVLISHGLPKKLVGATALEMNDVYDFSPRRLQFVLALAAQCQKAKVDFRLELPAAGTAAIDAAVHAVAREFEKRWKDLEVDLVYRDLSLEDRPLARLGRSLFSDGGEAQTAPELSSFSAATPRDEARHIARRIRRLVDEGTPPEQIAVAYRDLSEEAELLGEALDEVGLLARIRLGAPLASTSVGRLALELPLLVDDAFPVEQVVRFLESRYTPEISRGMPDSPAALLSLASVRDDRIGAVGERGAYEVRLEGLASRLEQSGRAEKARAVKKVLDGAQKLLQLGRKLPVEAKASKLLDTWWGCVEGLGLFEAVRKGEPRAAEGTALGKAVIRALARDQAASEALRELTAELDGALRQSGAGGQSMARRAFARWLADAAADFNLLPKGPRAGAVRVLDVRELVGARFAHVFVAGLVDGRFPGRAHPHALFTEEDRARTNAALGREVFRLSTNEGTRLPWRLAEDRLLLHQALAAATKTATLSFARRGVSGQEQLASPFLDELARVASLCVEPVPERPVALLEEVTFENELRERVSLEAFGRIELRTSEPDPARALLAQRFAAEEWFRAAGSLAAIEEERLRFFSNPSQPPLSFSGRVDDASLVEVLRQVFDFGPQRPVSATQLARFGNCAFQGFLAHALGLEEPELPGEEMGPRERGSYWHKVLELLFPRLRDEGLLRRPVQDVPDALLDDVLAAASAELERRGHVGHPALWRIGRERARSMVQRVLAAEGQGLPFEGHVPKHTELVFGRSGAAPGWEEVVLPAAEADEVPVHVAGSIDRLDMASADVGVVDYKAGRSKAPTKHYEELLSVEFQLPLYLYAAKSSGNAKALRAAWLSLRDGETVDFGAVLDKAGQSLEELLAIGIEARRVLQREGKKNLANAVHGLAKGLRAGNFPARPEDCDRCSFRAVCRITERRFQERHGD
ncbi:MAG: PD-(D/E)XK nuclease family protein [Myxococcota bacterium]